jgi:hypothetical protein
MNRKLEKIKNFRLHLLTQIEGLTTQQLNQIPQGFNNNVIWNLGHVVAAMQNICYVKAGLPVAIDDKYFTPFLPGTRPEKFIDEPEIKIIKELSIASVDRLQSDLDKNLFSNYTSPPAILKVYGFEVPNIEEAFDYVLRHEGFHQGYIHALKRML